ncbi:MAG: ABC transporter ATP-binding protein [Clostridia bacterium]|nr:ABC transporter ATP-binding protein [Clostridia bacterium]
MPRYIKLHEDVKVPVLKNVVYALKLCLKADKWLMLGYIIGLTAEQFFALFIQNILFLKTLLTAIDTHGDFKAYVKYLVLFLICSVILNILEWWGYYMSHVATKKVLQKLNNMVFEKAVSLDISCYEDPAFYDKYQRATNIMSSGYFDIICYDVALIVADTLAFICVVATITSINPVYLLFLVPVLFVFAIELYKSRAVYRRDLEMTKNNRIKAYIQRTVFLKDYSKDIRTSNIFLVLMKRFEAAIKANIVILRRYGLKLFVYSMVSSLFSEFIPIIGTYAYAGYEFVFKSSLTVSGFSVVISSINSIKNATLDIAECFDELSQMALFFENLRSFFDYEPKIVDGTKEAGEFESLEAKNISFKYPTAEVKSIDNISFKITKGETVAVVGINGAGKSTLVKLLLRFYDVDEGEILYNGVNIKEYKVESLRMAFATVFQDYKNFAVSVYENVMCRECSEEDKQKAKKALIQSGAWEKIKTFKKEGDTVLTREFEEDGAGLSGGENQKVSTARLFARDFQVAILDEPSSALDPVAEYKMYENLVEATKEKTVIYISHRLSSAVLSDKIIVLDKGRIVESGTHPSLMQSGGEYSEMFALQASSYNRKEGEYERESE